MLIFRNLNLTIILEKTKTITKLQKKQFELFNFKT